MQPYMNPFEPVNLLVVVRRAPRLVLPASETPRTLLYIPAVRAYAGYGSILSSHMLLFEAQHQHSFASHGTMSPSHAILRGLEKALVPYYPLAGRLRAPSMTGASAEHGKLELICNGLGAIFVEAKANVSLHELKQLDKVFWSQLHYDYVDEASMDVCPLVVQVTTLACGGFALSIRVLQSLCDSAGMLHFLHAWSAFTKTFGQNIPIVMPIWGGMVPTKLPQWPQKFHFPTLETVQAPVDYTRSSDYNKLEYRGSPVDYTRISDHNKPEYGESGDRSYYDNVSSDHRLDRRGHALHDDMHWQNSTDQQRLLHSGARDQPHYENLLGLSSMSISLEHLESLKDSIPGNCNKFEALAALFWRERTRVLGFPPSTEVVLFFPIPVAHDVHLAFYGQYGFNCMVSAQAGDLVQSELSDVVNLIQQAKMQFPEYFSECMKSFSQLHMHAALKHAPPHVLIFTVLWHGVEDIDFGTKVGPLAADATRLHSPVNVVAVTGALEDTIEVAMTNVPVNLSDKINRHLLQGPTFPSARPISGSRL